LTTAKDDHPLCEVSIVSDMPSNEKNATILASWTYGLGKTAVFTSDAGKRWTTQWTGWENYDVLFSQLVRWSMRPTGDMGKFTVASDYKDGKVRVVVTALDKDDEFLNFLDIAGSAVGPDMDSFDVKMRQASPGRYVGEFDTSQQGSYFLTLSPGPGRAPIRTGVSVPYSAEFRDRETNRALLFTLADLEPAGGESGKVIKGPMAAGKVDPLLEVDTFRHNLAKAISSQDVWPLLLLIAGCVFFADVFIRRVTIGFDWAKPMVAAATAFVLRRQRAPVKDERLARLRSRKAEVAGQIDERRAAARFEPQPDADVSTDVLTDDAAAKRPTTKKTAQPQVAPETEQEEESYTERLLKAKKKVWKDKGK